MNRTKHRLKQVPYFSQVRERKVEMSLECVLMDVSVVPISIFVTTAGRLFIPLMGFSHCGLTFPFVLKNLGLL